MLEQYGDMNSSLEALCAIAITYDPQALPPLAHIMAEENVGFHGGSYAGRRNGSFATLYSIAALICHMAECPETLPHLSKIAPKLIEAIKENVKTPWYTVIASLANAYY